MIFPNGNFQDGVCGQGWEAQKSQGTPWELVSQSSSQIPWVSQGWKNAHFLMMFVVY